MGFEAKPEDIKKSIRSRNIEHLRAAGRKGALVAAERRDIKATQDDLANEIKEIEEWERKVAANEHIISPDGEDLTSKDDTETLH